MIVCCFCKEQDNVTLAFERFPLDCVCSATRGNLEFKRYRLALVSMLIPGAFMMKMVCQTQPRINKPPLSQHGLRSGSGIAKEEPKKGRSNTIEREECFHLTSARVKVWGGVLEKMRPWLALKVKSFSP